MRRGAGAWRAPPLHGARVSVRGPRAPEDQPMSNLSSLIAEKSVTSPPTRLVA